MIDIRDNDTYEYFINPCHDLVQTPQLLERCANDTCECLNEGASICQTQRVHPKDYTPLNLGETNTLTFNEAGGYPMIKFTSGSGLLCPSGKPRESEIQFICDQG